MKKVKINGAWPIQVSLNLNDNLIPGDPAVNVSDEVWAEIKDMVGVELVEQPKKPKAKAKPETE